MVVEKVTGTARWHRTDGKWEESCPWDLIAIYTEVIIIHKSLGLIHLILGVNSTVLRTEGEVWSAYNITSKELFFLKNICFLPINNFWSAVWEEKSHLPPEVLSNPFPDPHLKPVGDSCTISPKFICPFNRRGPNRGSRITFALNRSNQRKTVVRNALCAALSHSFEGGEIYWLEGSIKLQLKVSFHSEPWINSMNFGRNSLQTSYIPKNLWL